MFSEGANYSLSEQPIIVWKIYLFDQYKKIIERYILFTKSRGYWDIKKSKNQNPNLSHK